MVTFLPQPGTCCWNPSTKDDHVPQVVNFDDVFYVPLEFLVHFHKADSLLVTTPRITRFYGYALGVPAVRETDTSLLEASL